ncbi:FadR/GntR family transcriptional regulator [Aeromicrobium endophyticum]|uniref:FadR family transcriptional regulator n=1 Tax=Aeromicrobium endophyticum TaxID=2292704 RepID=A0A371NYV3_9ACTN|nr:FCD domain-containing protein [Aeromicrobium endophyticum]REK68875.1 FadR family transcriptional regulator [Aeromicrobium endophyticum]
MTGVDDLRPGRTLSGYADVVEFVQREVSLGRLVPGQKLPAERKLAEHLGVARETLRQALRVLEGSGQVVIVRGTAGGAVIQDTGLAPHVALHVLRQRRDDLLDLVEFRSELESVAARMSASRRASQHLDEMADAQDALHSAENKDQSRRADTAFHLAVARASGNPPLAAAIEDARASMFHSVDLVDYEFIKESSHAQHQLVFESIVAGDGAAAAEHMRRHVELSRLEMLKMIDG